MRGAAERSDQGLFPGDEEIDRLIVGPESITWQFTSDVRLLFAPLCALVLQVAHPTVAAGVRDYSDFDRRPWERLLRTLDYLVLLQYGGRDAVAVGRELRELHKRFRGARGDGETYYALERGAYAWVHATLIETYVRAHAHFGRPMTRDQLERFYREYVGLGRLAGVRAADLPPTWDGFRAYFERTVERELGPNRTVERVLQTARKPAAPPLPRAAVIAWRAFRPPAAKVAYLGGVGLLGASLRDQLKIPWSRREEWQFRAFGASTRALDPLLPAGLKVFGPTQLRWRRRAIARGPFGHALLRPR
jgi:uncharacterized protein (DUF2236 family)